MREMVLNHASIGAPTSDTAVEWLKDLVIGLSELVGEGVVDATLRARHFPHEICYLPGKNLLSLSMDLLQSGAREEFLFFSTLNSKVPLMNDADPEAESRFLSCQHRTIDSEGGEPLLYCAITRAISVGFPSTHEWDQDSLTVAFEELLPNGEFEEWDENIDNVVRQQHALNVIDRHRIQLKQRLSESSSGAAIWASREEAFPHLLFGRDVESHLSVINPGELGTLINRLATLDEAAAAWPIDKGEVPSWKSKVTDENHSVKTNPRLREARRFRSNQGTRELFYWHARFGAHRRIHLRFDRTTYAVEIGYIGNHLPL